MSEPRGAECARAKVNLFLHIRRRRDDGYHELESLAVFPSVGDLVSAAPAAEIGLTISGPFAAGLEIEGNLVLKAARALCECAPGRPGAALHLEKRLPVASGLGGGSADAGAALRLLCRLWGVAPDRAERIAPALGADAPVCLRGSSAMMSGVGERLAPPPPLPSFWLLLVNPGIALSTAEVFRALPAAERPGAGAAPQRFADLADFTNWLARRRNDLEDPALSLRPAIGEALAALRAQPRCRLARMSGSGASCFAIFDGRRDAEAAGARIRAAHPRWWTQAGSL